MKGTIARHTNKVLAFATVAFATIIVFAVRYSSSSEAPVAPRESVNFAAIDSGVVEAPQATTTLLPTCSSLQAVLDDYKKEWTYDSMLRFVDAINLLPPAAEVVGGMCSRNALWGKAAVQFSSSIKDRLFRLQIQKCSGVLFLCAGNSSRGGASLVHHSYFRTSFRKGWFPQQLIKQSAMMHIANFTILFMPFQDTDIYYHAMRRGGIHSSSIARIHELLGDFPNFFFLHYNPLMKQSPPDEVGQLYPRMVAIPHSLQQEKDIVAVFGRSDYHLLTPWEHVRNRTLNSSLGILSGNRSLVSFSMRKRQIVWRGATTGSSPFRQCDRYKMVHAFHALQVAKNTSVADVGFSGLCQRRSIRDVPQGLKPKIPIHSLVHVRIHLDVDGNGNSWEGLRWRMVTGMATVKVESSQGFTQWYYPMLKHGVHLLHVNVEDVTRVALELLEDEEKGELLAWNAMKFGLVHLSHEAVKAAVVDAVKNVWLLGYHGVKRDWRIQR